MGKSNCEYSQSGRESQAQNIKKALNIPAFYRSELGADIPAPGGDGWSNEIICPFHDETAGSFGVNLNNGRFKCFGCNASGDVFDFYQKKHGVGFHESLEALTAFAGVHPGGNGDGKAKAKKSNPGQLVAEYLYKDATGNPYLLVRRFVSPENPKEKTFRQFRPDGNGKWLPGVKGRELYPYHLPELLVADGVFIPEGEKDVDALLNILPAEYSATCNPMGAGEWPDNFKQYFKDKYVVVLPDKDPVGVAHAEDVAQNLSGVAASVKVLHLPGLPHKGDVSDFIESKGSEAMAELLDLADDCPEWTRQGTGPPPADAPHQWPEIEPLPDELRPVKPFDYNLIPSELQLWVKDIADRMQCPPDYVGASAMVVAGALIGRRVCICPKKKDDFKVIPNLWGLIIGPPAYMKSPAQDDVLKPVKRLEIDAKENYVEAAKDHEAALQRAKIQMDLTKEAAKKALKAGKPNADVDAMFKGDADSIGLAPVRERYLTSDTSVEKLGELLNENPQGLLLFRDELYGFLKTINREDRTNDRAFYLEAWSGLGRYTYDRIGRGTIDIESVCVSILGGIQPGRLASFIRGAVRGGADDDGLAQRFQLAVYPDLNREWKIVDRWPDKEAKDRAYHLFERLAALPVPDPGGDNIPAMRFDDEAQGLFYSWWTELETELRGGELHPAMEAHLVKYRSLIPALTLICHLCETPDADIPVVDKPGLIPVEPLQRALAWSEYLRSHAERIYGLALAGNMGAAKSLLRKIISGKVNNPFRKRDVVRARWAGLADDPEVSAALSILIDYGYLTRVTAPTGPAGGRPTVEYHLNPKAGEVSNG
jgi:hypothetical protein